MKLRLVDGYSNRSYSFVVRVRRFQIEDTPYLIDMFRRTVHTVGRLAYSAGQLDVWAPQSIDPSDWNDRLLSGYTLVADSAGERVGFACLKDDGCIDMLYVAADRQGQGIATRLLAALEEEAHMRGTRRLYSDVSLTARKFFLAKGFVVEKEYLKKLAGFEFPNAIMAKDLK